MFEIDQVIGIINGNNQLVPINPCNLWRESDIFPYREVDECLQDRPVLNLAVGNLNLLSHHVLETRHYGVLLFGAILIIGY